MTDPTYEPGSLREVHYLRGRDKDGNFPVTLWGSIDEQVAEATAVIREQLSGARHRTLDLFTTAEDCTHTDPEIDERFDNVDDLVQEWLERNCLMEHGWPGRMSGLTPEQRSARHRLVHINQQRAYAAIPLAAEFAQAQNNWEAVHDGGVCVESPMGSVRTGCLEDAGEDAKDSEFGFEPSPCVRQERAHERRSDFWDMAAGRGIQASTGTPADAVR